MSLLITDDYRRLNAEKHAVSERYGSGGHKHAGTVSWIIKNYEIKSVLDYGCGKATLAEYFPDDLITCYDPCIPEYSARPSPAELVVSTDVMEHIEPECLDEVLKDIASLTLRYAYLNISTVEANKHLPDGRNIHLTVQPWQWWVEKLRPHFTMTEGELFSHTFNVICRKKNLRLC